MPWNLESFAAKIVSKVGRSGFKFRLHNIFITNSLSMFYNYIVYEVCFVVLFNDIL